jgi:hypothetical protein
MEKSRCLHHGYAEGVHGEREESQFTSIATVLPSNRMGTEDVKAWFLILETAFMLIFQTLDSDMNDCDVPQFQNMYPTDMGNAPFLGANRTASIRKFTGHRGKEETLGEAAMTRKIFRLLHACKKSANTEALTRCESESRLRDHGKGNEHL